ncbi:unnamed protein product [Urochloa humidicola]
MARSDALRLSAPIQAIGARSFHRPVASWWCGLHDSMFMQVHAEQMKGRTKRTKCGVWSASRQGWWCTHVVRIS